MLPPVDDAVAVLDPGHVDELERKLDLRLIDVGEPDQIELALVAHVLERRQLLLERYGGVVSGLNEAQAFDRLRRASQVSGRPLRVIAEAVVATLGEAG